MSGWLQYGNSSNKLSRTYLKEFLDVSGNLILRNGGLNITNGSADINGNTRIRGGLIVDGPISFIGNVIQVDICYNVMISEQVDISNVGTGPALIVRQFGDQPIARFYDDSRLAVAILDGGDVSMNNDLKVFGTSSLQNTTITGGASVSGTLNVGSNSTLVGSLNVNSSATIGGTLRVNGISTLSGATISGGASVSGALNVGSNSTIVGTLNVNSTTPARTGR